ncbi:MAG: hypothetical protein AVDCRST_MAG88-365, partial [uncultured Thermomicrobiales bacterium]
MGAVVSGRRRRPGQYTVPEVARQLGISERAVRLRIEVGTLSAIRDGRQWWVTLPGLDEAVVSGSQSGSRSGREGGSRSGSDAPPDDEAPSPGPPAEPLDAAYRVTPAE